MTGAQNPVRRPGAVRRLLHGAAMPFRGFGLWRARPGAMLLGLLPALIVSAVLVAGLVVLATAAPVIAAAVTPFADDWDAPWPDVVRALVGLGLVLGALWIAVAAFTGITLAVGDPFYERIWRAAEAQSGGPVPDHAPGFWTALGDALLLVLGGIGVAVLTALLGFVPVVGSVLGVIVGIVLSGRLLAAELLSRPLEARGIRGDARRALLRGRGAEQLGFGIAVQLCFLVPGGAIAVMPSAVVGATLLAREALDATPPSAAAGRAGR